MSESSAPQPPQAGLGLGTFLGVYTPTVLTILGVILYLRMGWVVGQVGVPGSLLIVVIANAITLITALSLSSLSTNMRVGVGGAYFIISRSMGLEMGGALGIPLYLSQVLSVTLYAFGLAESSLFILGHNDAPTWLVQVIAATIIVAVTGLAARSTMLALKAQLPIMLLIVASLIAFVAGVDWAAPMPDQTFPESVPHVSFWGVFAVFFPAVTGVMAGLGLSGDLKDPGKSLPTGVLFAVATGFIVYISAPIVLGQAASVEQLLNNKLVWGTVAVGGLWFIVPGLLGAVLSSAIGSILGAPRTLQALASDGLMPAVMGELDEKTGEPMKALYLSGALALGAVLLGDLNAVAGVVSMFFLTTYGTLNLAAALEAWVADPSFRPRLKVPFWMSLLGAIGCFLAMALIDPLAFVAAVVIEAALWWWLSRRRLTATWGDLRSGFWFAAARVALVKLRTARVDARNWRPNILVFSPEVKNNIGMIRLATDFCKDRGVVTVCTLVQGHLDERAGADTLLTVNRELLDEAGVLAFPEVHVVSDLEAGLLTTAQANGFAGIESNLVALGWPRKPERLPRLMRWVRHLDDLGKSTMIVHPGASSRLPDGTSRQVLVWWKGKESNGDLMLLLAHLLVLSKNWRGAKITLVSAVDSEEEGAALEQRARASLDHSNISTDFEYILIPPDTPLQEIIRARSAQADLVFLGLALPAVGQEEVVAASMARLVKGLPDTVLVRNSSPFRGQLV
ncbi:MAG: potassium/chloride transporter 4/5/6 [Myxococcota bacterium]|jgi:potassium/chloride transporter 4/5/6